METPTKELKRGYAFSENLNSPERGVSSATQLARRYAFSEKPYSPEKGIPSTSNEITKLPETEVGQDRFGGKRKRKSKKGGKWSMKYKRSINCRKPKGFSQRQHCKYGRRSRRR